MRKPLNAILSSTQRLIANAVLFQCGWWIIVLSQGTAAWLFACLLLLFHIIFISQRRYPETTFIILLAGIGITADAFWFSLGLMLTAGENQLPLWLIPMWLAFATTVAHSLHWLARTPYLAAFLGAVLGPLSYWAGAALTDITITQPTMHWLLFLASFWGVLLPLSFTLWKYLIRTEKRKTH